MEQTELFPDEWEFIVSINCWHEYKVCTIKEAWDIIGKSPFGSTFVVYDKQGHVVPEFISF